MPMSFKYSITEFLSLFEYSHYTRFSPGLEWKIFKPCFLDFRVF
ncbi:hypothetical protein HOLDEFILI_03268 [Holdemania filiformis DSM 12042]|uniref:Uncharacterized protein n=1 Tax=Holdemania filiformis DSM 12042 TaxID=545696 RepID=B9YBR0_9FIRM|nr:hypothetical protein HOLDEFILI_03268 [Holdemania filiformis DSM 12042]